MNLINWINKHLEYIAFFAVILSILWIIFGPLILTQHYFSVVDFSDENGNTGTIGDTIGGITAPIIGLISTILLYLALIKQIESNRATVHEANFRIINSELSDLKSQLDKYSLHGKSSTDAFSSFADFLGTRLITKTLNDSDYQLMKKFELFTLNKVDRIFYLLDSLKTSIVYKDILFKDLESLFYIYFNDCYSIILSDWDIPESDWIYLERGKMLMIKEHFEKINMKILKIHTEYL